MIGEWPVNPKFSVSNQAISPRNLLVPKSEGIEPRSHNGSIVVAMKRSAKDEIEKLRKLAEKAASLRQTADELQAKSERLHKRVDDIRKRITNRSSTRKRD